MQKLPASPVNIVEEKMQFRELFRVMFRYYLKAISRSCPYVSITLRTVARILTD